MKSCIVNRILLLSIFVLADCSVAVATPKAGQRANEFKLNADGFETNKKGEIIRVDRNRVFDKFVVTMPVSTKKWPSGFVGTDENGEEKKDAELFPFEHARVRSLVICGDALKAKNASFKTISLTGVEELSEIVIRGEIPRFKEENDDWRRGLKRIVLEDQVAGLMDIPFIGKVKCLSFGTNTVRQVCEKWGNGTKNALKDLNLRKCCGLEQLEVPYCMATNMTIQWGALIRNSPLKDREVVSVESVEGGDKTRSEERRVGKECRSRWSPYH